MSFLPLSPLTQKLFDLPDYAQRENNICSMVNFFPEAKRLMDAVRIKRIVEIGSEAGVNTAVLLNYAKRGGMQLVTVDPAEVSFPFSPSEEPAFRFYQESSADFLKRNISAEVIFMDGDHNYETVLADLKVIHESRRENKIKILFLHDVGWPWARQDIYYDPARIVHPHPFHADNRVSPYTGGENMPSLPPASYMTSDIIGGPENGVLTAVEDFLTLYGSSWRFQRIPVLYGIGILISLENLTTEEQQKLFPLVEELASHNELLSILELNRIENLCQYDSLLQELKRAGKVWLQDQGYIKSVNELLPGFSAEIEEKKAEIGRLQQSLKERDTANNELQECRKNHMLRLQAAACEKSFFLTKIEDLKLSLKKESETVAQRQAELSAVRETLSDRENQIQTLNESVAQRQTELSAVRETLSDRENQIQTLLQLSDEQKKCIETLEELDRKNKSCQRALEQELRTMKFRHPSEKWRIDQFVLGKVLPYRLRNYRRLKQIKKELADGSVKLLSLDVFDTLLFRELHSEQKRFSDVGKILHQRFSRISAEQFYHARSLAHYLAYRICPGTEGCREPSAKEIFLIMARILQLPEEVVPELMKTELEYEIAHLHLNGAVWELVLLAQKQNIPVIAASDMYWGKEALQKIFAVHLPDPEVVRKIYSSSDYGVSKAAGILFERIAEENGVGFAKIMHLGDNPQSDLTVPFIQHGVNAFWLPRSKCYLSFCNLQQKREKIKLQRRIIHGI